jgi:hypothetical protein
VSVHCDAADNRLDLLSAQRPCLLIFVQRFISVVLRLLLVGAGLVFAACLLVAGLVLTLLLVGWSLIRGRRPRVVRFRVDPRSPFAGMRRGAAEGQGEVVDIEAREVPDVPQQLQRDER